MPLELECTAIPRSTTFCDMSLTRGREDRPFAWGKRRSSCARGWPLSAAHAVASRFAWMHDAQRAMGGAWEPFSWRVWLRGGALRGAHPRRRRMIIADGIASPNWEAPKSRTPRHCSPYEAVGSSRQEQLGVHANISASVGLRAAIRVRRLRGWGELWRDDILVVNADAVANPRDQGDGRAAHGAIRAPSPEVRGAAEAEAAVAAV